MSEHPEPLPCLTALPVIRMCLAGARHCADCAFQSHMSSTWLNGMTPAQIVAEHPDLEEEDVRQALAYAAAIAEDQIYPIPAGK